MVARTDCRVDDHHGDAYVHGYDHARDDLRDRDHKGSDQKSENVREVYG